MRRGSTLRPLRRMALVVALLAGATLAFGVTGADCAAWRAFDAAADRWQANPDFRCVALEYSRLGSRALHTRLFGVPGAKLVVALRSLPFLPERFALSPTSRSHYADFDRGPLSAYLHLCGEQSPADLFASLRAAGRQAVPPVEDLRRMIDAFHMDAPICGDAGALDGVRSLVRDVGPRRPFAVRGDVGPRLLPDIRAVARRIGVPDEPERMTPDQQAAVLDRLDGQVRAQDPELWRTKQLSDFCAGVWAQVYSSQYQIIIRPVVALHEWGTAGLVLLLAWRWAALVRQGRSSESGLAEAAPSSAYDPRPARAAGNVD